MNRTPDMSGEIAEITDPKRLYARLGYHVYRRHVAEREGVTGKVAFYEDWIKSELRRLTELNIPPEDDDQAQQS